MQVDLTVTAVRDDAGNVTGYLGVALDVTARNQAEGDLIYAKEAAEAANHAKSDFLANMSHEIRTPINGIIGMEGLLQQTGLTGDQHEYLDALGNCANVLLELVNEVLDYSKIEAGRLEIHTGPVRLQSLLDETLAPMRLRAETAGLKFVTSVDPNLPAILETDGTRIRQVLNNLVGNAIKFTESGEISIRVGSVSVDADVHTIQFDVTDTGPGIPPDDQLLIFDPFIQSDSSSTRRFGGTGLGLTIANRLVELLGGKIWLNSQPGTGSTFHFTIGAKRMADITEPTGTGQSETALPEKSLRILLAEDHPVNQLFASRVLQKRGHEVTIAENGQDALTQVFSKDFDIVLMDIQMPVMDGLEAIARIRQREKGTGQRMPIVALTAHAMNGYDQKCYAAGADGYISKPLRPVDLFTTIRKLTTDCGTTRTATVESDSESKRSLIAASVILQNTGNDAELATELIEIFQTDLPDTIQQLEDAIRNEDLEVVSRLAHSLKSPLMMFGADESKEQSHKLEVVAREQEDDQIEETFRQLKQSLADVSRSLESVNLTEKDA